jgi:hypothetical protein|nr:hypothetical protein [uncultured Limnohabitans sp.]
MTDDFFHNRLDQMTDLRHPLAVLANRMPWQEIEASIVQRWLLRMIVKKGLGLLLCLLQASGLDGLFEKLTEILGINRLQNSDQCWVLV